MSRLRMWQVWMATVVLSTGFTVVPGVAAGNTQTFTGKVSDAMCGAKHTEGGIAPADCVCVCMQKGAKYAFGRWGQGLYPCRVFTDEVVAGMGNSEIQDSPSVPVGG